MDKKNLDRKNLKFDKTLFLEIIFLAVLCLYPMRHIQLGIDLRDTGYNFANHQYMGLDHMDSMWVFATYLANVTGHFFTCLPWGHTLMGMNFYTGLLPVFMAVFGYWFCTRKLHISAPLVFLGEFLALNLCWCPTAVLYNYLTYTLYLAAIVLVYEGLVREKRWILFVAGLFLGSNVLVRFSNLPEAGLILAVWLYAIFYATEQGVKKDHLKETILDILKKIGLDTLWCVLGYMSALVVWYGWIAVRYGIGNYVAGIQRLFAMTENATDYKADSMIKDGLIKPFLDLSYWVIRFGFFIFLALILSVLGKFLYDRLIKQNKQALAKTVLIGSLSGSGICLVGLMVWLYVNKFTSFLYYSYDPIMRPATLFLFFALVIAGIHLFRPGCRKEERLIASMVAVVILLTSLGSNTGLMASYNFLFIPAPYVMWQLYVFLKWSFKKIAPLPIAVGVWLLVLVTIFHCSVFGLGFVFAESSGIRNPNTKINSNKVLWGIYMTEKRAAWMQATTDYVNERDLAGKEVLLYGDIPGISFYFQMPSCFNPWSDLPSFSASQMEKEMALLEEQITSGEKEKPVIILEHIYHMMYLGKRDVLEAEGENPEYLDYLESNPKWEMIKNFLDKYYYGTDYECIKLGIWLPDTGEKPVQGVDQVISVAYADVDFDGEEELLTIESLDASQTIESGEPYGNYLRIYEKNDQSHAESTGDNSGNIPVHEFDLSYVKPMFLQVGDVNGDSITEIGVIAYKTTEYHPVLAKRPFFYALNGDQLEKVWLGSRLSRPFTDFVLCDLDGDGISEIISAERTNDEKYVLAMYNWEGFGFDLECQTEAFDTPIAFEIDRDHIISKVVIKISEKDYTVTYKASTLILQ